jgi:excisionase family DNA binding protein
MSPRKPPALTLAQAAALLGVDRGVALSCVRHGTLPAARAGTRWRVRPEDLEAWLEAGGRAEIDAARALAATAVAPAHPHPRARRARRRP